MANPPGIARGRRAFLAPLWIAALAALFASTVLFVGVHLAVTRLTLISTIIVLRHAETLDTVADDPPLSVAGEARAQRLARMFGVRSDTGAVQAIFASVTRRARQTAAPLASRLDLPVVTVDGRDLDTLLARLRTDGRGRTSLVVGHSDTVPQIVARLTGGRVKVAADDADFESVFVVTLSSFGPPSVLRLRY